MESRLWPLIERQAARHPHEVFVRDEHDRVLTFEAYRAKAERVAAALYERGVGPGTRVSWQLPVWIESAVLLGALARLHAVQNPLLALYRDREIGFIVRQFRPTLFVCPSSWRDVDHRALAERAIRGLPVPESCDVLVCDRSLPEADPARLPAFADLGEAAVDDIRWVIYTSGTTADPKGAMHPDAALAAPSWSMVDRMRLDEHDLIPIMFPYAHVGGLCMLFAQIISGAAAILIERYEGDTTLDRLHAEPITIAAGGTTIVQQFLDHQRRHGADRVFPHLRYGLAGAAPKPPLLHREVREELGGIGVLSSYGLTEVPMATVTPYDATDVVLATTEGSATDGCELRAVAADGTVCAPGVEGEIRMRGVNVLRGYLDPALDAEAFDSDGWFRTGDLGHLDERGNVVITGRTKDIIIRKGENIAAKRVEDVLYAHPAVLAVAVIGLPDARSGERCCAVVVPRDPTHPPTFDELAEFCAAQGLARHMVPEQLELTDDLPRTAMGKVIKRDLQQRYGVA